MCAIELRPDNAPSDAVAPSPKSRTTSRTGGALAGGETSTLKVTASPATGSVGLTVRATGIAGAGSTRTPTDEVATKPATSVAVTDDRVGAGGGVGVSHAAAGPRAQLPRPAVAEVDRGASDRPRVVAHRHLEGDGLTGDRPRRGDS